MSFWNSLSDAIDSVTDSVGTAYDYVSDKTGEAIDSVTDSASTAYDYVSDKAGEAIDSVADSASTAYDYVSDKAGETVELIKENPGKTALGAVIGVGAVAAAPFTGGGSVLGCASLLASLTGAGVAVTATGTACALAAAKFSDSATKQTKEAVKKNEEIKWKAKIADITARHEEKLKQALSETSDLYQAIVAMCAVGVSVAACDGHVSESEKLHIESFISGKASKKLPASVRKEIEDKYRNPPNIKEAFQIAIDSGLDMEFFDDIIFIVIMADDIEHEDEIAYAHAWEELKKTA
ncbi:hypothetical protein [uncultured Tolumonas sp.]|uniref:hypothetical protein n=1 Tax=uncultured Tolumonas sp. TaxID=263765 RepID=UPI00293050CB|nr:hypothetical protein [uncultured Tolumonas sp.]